jgi:glycosyltransferase involved in cell wall biosynthesis
MKTILIITDNTQEQVNGVVTTFNNIEKHAISDGFNIAYIDPYIFPHAPAPGYPDVMLSYPKNIGDRIMEIQPQFIHIATEGPIGLAAKLWLDKKRWKYNTSYHTKFPEFLNKLYRIPIWISYAYLRWFHKHSGIVLTTTNTMVNELKKNKFKGKILSWTRGVDRSIFYPRQKNDKDIVLLNVGRVSKEKGLEDFCSIEYPNVKKVVVGDGPYRQELEKRYTDVNFVGTKKGNELAEYFARADVFVFPSREDTFGIVMIEAMASGTPVAAYKVTGPKDVIDDGVTGYMNSNLTTAIHNCLSLNRREVFENSKKWSWENCWNIFKQNLIPIT